MLSHDQRVRDDQERFRLSLCARFAQATSADARRVLLVRFERLRGISRDAFLHAGAALLGRDLSSVQVACGSDTPPAPRCGAAARWDTRRVGTEGPDLAAPEEAGRADAAVDLYWLPLGAGGRFVRLNGRIYEALAARMRRRPVCDLYHSALQVELAGGRFVIEQTPVPRLSGEDHGVVVGGAVGARWAGRFRIFRYEIRVWRGGHIPDVAEAVDSPRRLTTDVDQARRVLEVVRQVPTPVWGRDELRTGEMWNSNAVIAWVIARSRLDVPAIRPPAGGRAPGWQAGLIVAARQGAGAKRPGAALTADSRQR
jgi:hypothetical protein